MEIKKLWSFLTTDEDGYFTPVWNIKNIHWVRSNALKDIVKGYIEIFWEWMIESIRVRGSAAKGEAIEWISDIDTICITKDKMSLEKWWWKVIRDNISIKYKSIQWVELYNLSQEEVYQNKWRLFTLNTQWVRLLGAENDKIEHNKFSPTKELSQSIIEKDLLSKISLAKEGFINEPHKIKIKCIWIMKRVLRWWCVLVMHKSKKFSRDLYPCWEIFSEYYPEEKENMYKALERSINPIDDSLVLNQYLDDFWVWLANEIQTEILDWESI